MLRYIKKINLCLFAFVVFCFVLPFVNITCSGEKKASFTGFELATGTKVTQHNMYGYGSSNRKVDAEPLALLALMVAVAGIIITISNSKNKNKIIHKMNGVVGFIGFVLLLLLALKLDSDVSKQTGGSIAVTYQVGYYLSVFAFLTITILNASQLFLKNNSPTISKKCPSCGEEYKEGAKFCTKCGKELS